MHKDDPTYQATYAGRYQSPHEKSETLVGGGGINSLDGMTTGPSLPW
jgi:hypothetical protein